jgi:hypothetical protein
MTVASQVMPSFFDRHAVLEKCQYLTACQLWPLRARADPEGWLKNFLDDELQYATQLLNSVLLFRHTFMDEMFRSAFQSLSRSCYEHGDSATVVRGRWRAFVDTVLITHVSGEIPSPTDSGYAFARRAKKVLGIDETRILPPEVVLAQLAGAAAPPVVFVDDFVGSGSQFIHSWHREYTVDGSSGVSFARVAASGNSRFFYAPLICTELGRAAIQTECPEVEVQAAHVLDPRYSAVHPDSVIWPQALRTGAAEFIKAASKRAGIPDSPGDVNHFEGFGSLGLTVAFEDTVPDATLPILRWKSSTWEPLFRYS